MWTIVATVLAIAIFAKIVFIGEDKSFRAIRDSALANATQSAGVQIASFARAARTYSQTNSLSDGTTISVSNLTDANLLPIGFPATTPFKQTLEAKVGTSPSVVVAYATGTLDLSAFGIDSSVLQNQQSVMWKAATVAQTNLENVTGVMVGISATSSLSGAAPYTYLWQPFAGSGFAVTTYVPAFSVTNPTAVVLFPS
jgi:hypothetical protein